MNSVITSRRPLFDGQNDNSDAGITSNNTGRDRNAANIRLLASQRNSRVSLKNAPILSCKKGVIEKKSYNS